MGANVELNVVSNENAGQERYLKGATHEPREESLAPITDVDEGIKTHWQRDSSNPMRWSSPRKWTIILLIAVANFFVYVVDVPSLLDPTLIVMVMHIRM